MTRRSRQPIPSHAPVRTVRPASAPLLARLFDEAVRHHQAGALAKAEGVYRRIIDLDPSHAMVWSNLAAILTQTGDPDEALAACRRALDLMPGHLNAQLNLAGALQKKGAFQEAIQVLDEALQATPACLELWKTFGHALERGARFDDAAIAYGQWAALQPENADARYAKGQALKRANRVDDAIAAFGEVVALDPGNASAYSEMGILMAMHSLSNDLDEAAALCLRAAALKPDSVAILNNLAVVLQYRGETDNALLVLDQMIALDPGFAAAHSNKGAILSSRNRYDEAEDAFERALACDPTLYAARIELTKVRRNICNWANDAEDRRTIVDLMEQGTNFLIVLMTTSASAEEQFRCARASMAKYNDGHVRIGAHRLRRDRTRIRVGYLSADFKDHPVGRLLPDLVAAHDRAAFEVFAYSIGPGDKSALRRRLVETFDHVIDLHHVSDALAAKRILDDEIDILVDLTGPTAGSRFEILALRPAPVQVSFLGMPGTSGADCIDYIVADPFLLPAESEPFFSEKVMRLPHCYQPSDVHRFLGDTGPTRTEFGLPAEGFVFCSFNSAVKITREVFDVWLRLLDTVEGSVLWLYAKTTKTRANLLAYATEAGIAADRIVFAGSAPYDTHLRRLAVADLFLDTFPYAAGATANDALWVGTPVLTLVGETYVSRMAGSLLHTLGVPELVTTSLADYEAIAHDLATDPATFAAIRARVDRGRAESPLFDMTRFTRALERGFVNIVARADAGEDPANFTVDIEID